PAAVRAPVYAAAVRVKADAIPLEEPLAGGVQGASVVVEPLDTGEALWPGEFFDFNGRGPLARLRGIGSGASAGEWESRPVPVYLVHHPGIGPMLIDTGLHPSVARSPKDKLGRFTARHYRVEEGKDLISQLRNRGISPPDIAVVV